MTELVGESVLVWAAGALESRIVAVEPLHDRGPWRLHVERGGRNYEVVLRIPVPNWIIARSIATGAAALQLAEKHGLPAPRLIASDLDGLSRESPPPWKRPPRYLAKREGSRQRLPTPRAGPVPRQTAELRQDGFDGPADGNRVSAATQ